MPADSPELMEHFLEALSLAHCYETQNPPNPITRAALEHSIRDLIVELQTLNTESQPASQVSVLMQPPVTKASCGSDSPHVLES